MSDIKELKDEELEKVTGGAVAKNADGYYVINKGDHFDDRGDFASNIYALESKTTNNVNDTVYCCVRQANAGGVTVSDRNVKISYLNNCAFKGNIEPIDPHTI